jgi:hypothetical protein
MRINCKMWAFCSVFWVFLGCGEEPVETDYLVEITVVGKAEAFADRTMKIINQTLGPRRPVIIGDTVTDEFKAEVTLCTKDLESFINDPILITVSEGDQVISEQMIERFACKYSPHEIGNQEYSQVYLELDGSIDAKFGNSENAGSECLRPNYSLTCQGEPDF